MFNGSYFRLVGEQSSKVMLAQTSSLCGADAIERRCVERLCTEKALSDHLFSKSA